jgi:hypothetical protein
MSAGETRAGRSFADPDRFYQALVDAYEGLDAEQSRLLNARLILLLAAHLGDDEQAHALLREAKQGIGPSAGPAGSD